MLPTLTCPYPLVRNLRHNQHESVNSIAPTILEASRSEMVIMRHLCHVGPFLLLNERLDSPFFGVLSHCPSLSATAIMPSTQGQSGVWSKYANSNSSSFVSE